MGTTYHVTVSELPRGKSVSDIQAGVENVLGTVNRQMSNWSEDSEISQFNRSDSTDWFEVSPETAFVIAEAIRISEETGGAFDVTVAPLIDLWGFGPAGRDVEQPTDEQLDQLAEIIGSDKLSTWLEPPAAIRKDVAGVSVNLSAIAKGYGVDAVAVWLEAQGIENYLVEIGGEVRVAGNKPDDSRWRVAIERPIAGQRSRHTTVELTDRSMATSGDYRNFIEQDGRRYSHTIDPRTRKPVTHPLASVTVLAESCLEADALATSLMVMGPDAGYNWAEHRGIPVLMLIHDGEGFSERSTTAWQQAVGETQ
jgi:thiamine biosynthesis lipoprotein